ncbi:MAG: response regulator [Endomicrobiales bacterium]|jgi:DNA-binding response OmpR family regulator
MENKMRILVIDDDPDVLDFLKTFFTSLNHEVVTHNNAQDGLKALVSIVPDLVLLDIMLPQKNGLELLKEIKELDSKVPVAMITAYKDAERVIEAFRLGAMDCLLKPFNLDYIKNTVLPNVKIRPK